MPENFYLPDNSPALPDDSGNEIRRKKPEVPRRKGVRGRRKVRPAAKREHTEKVWANQQPQDDFVVSSDQRRMVEMIRDKTGAKSRSEVYRYATEMLYLKVFGKRYEPVT